MNAKKSILINPIIARNIHEHHRAATPLELFYDLIYVVAIASLATQFHHAVGEDHHIMHAILMYLFMFWCIWWPWNAYTWYASGFDTDDAQFRLASFVQMVGAIVMAAGIESAFKNNNFIIMMLGYVIMRIPYILMWLKTAYDDINSRPVALRYAIGVTLTQLSWSFAVLYFQSWFAFCLLLLLEMLVPYIAESATDKGKNTRYHAGHIEERLGLLTIIVLGESILATGYAVSKFIEHFDIELLKLLIGSMLILFSMWWLYFDDKLEEALHSESTAFIWSYGHYFVLVAATAVGALISVNVDVITHHAEISNSQAVMGLAFCLAVYLVAIWFVHDFLLQKNSLLEKAELPLLAVLIMIVAYMTKSILLISFIFVGLNAVRVLRQHHYYPAKNETS